MNPLVSVIMTTYNVEKYVAESLESVLKQDIENIEIICIDGHSTDRTVQIINEFQRKDPRVKLFYQTRPGIGAAKNEGIEKATGEFITFLDADDLYMDVSALRIMYNACKKEDVLVCGAFRSVLEMDGTIWKESLHRHEFQNNRSSVRLEYRERQYDYHFHSYLYNRKMILGCDARFAEVKAYDDTHYFIRAMLAAKEFCVVPVELYCYRGGPAYEWGMDKANDSILTLIDQLRISKANNLSYLHWLTVQRINYEYGNIYVKNVRKGDYLLLTRLIEANNEIDGKMLNEVERKYPPKWYTEPMLHRPREHLALRQIDCEYAPEYITEPLWKLMFEAAPPRMNRFTQEICIQETRWMYLKRKIRGGITCLRENGLRYTIIHTFRKINNRMKRLDK